MEYLLFIHGFIAIPILLGIAANSIYIRKQLGRLEYRVFTRLQSAGMVVFILMLILRIGMAIYGLTSYYKSYDTILLVFVIRDIAPSAINLLVIYLLYKNGEIREKGIYANFSILEWQSIKYFAVKTEEIIEITTNKKSVFNKKGKKVKWEVDNKEKINTIKGLLSRYIQKNGDNDDIIA
ncbi:MAG: hypothetical protein JJT76_11180 [Clostridiaceae bacterium]|nr:hypothetical protein [Clostridiaceae bacterium]